MRPVRTCVGCRRRDARDALLRVVAGTGGRLLPDPARVLPGRGANLHPSPECLALAERRRAFPRTLRLSGPVDLSAVREHVTRQAGAASG